MNDHWQGRFRCAGMGWAVGAAALAALLCACVHDGLDDVKPTETTAYHSAPPAAPSPGTAVAPAQPRQ
jgi:hypothetical protein